MSLIFAVINATLRPLIKLLTCPLILLTLGLFALVVNGLMLWLTSLRLGVARSRLSRHRLLGRVLRRSRRQHRQHTRVYRLEATGRSRQRPQLGSEPCQLKYKMMPTADRTPNAEPSVSDKAKDDDSACCEA